MSDSEKKNDRFKIGMATRRAVLGEAHVDRATAAMTEFDEPFQTFITEGDRKSVV
jgi:4-carboxymuconolactone decarboxylase